MKNRLKHGDALLIVDAQVDFFPGGALPVPRGDEILKVINEWVEAAVEKKIPIFASRDWHPVNHCSFKAQGGPWPAHCIQHSEGAKIHPKIKLPENTVIIDTADDPNAEAYSAFKGKTLQGIPLDKAMKAKGIHRLWISGLALDYCVSESALDAVKNGYEVHLLLEGTRAIADETGKVALKKMIEAGVIIEK